jgi:hypothetical protein
MKKFFLALMFFAILPLLIIGCSPPQNRHATPNAGGVCSCGHDHGAEGHVDPTPVAPEPAPEPAKESVAEATPADLALAAQSEVDKSPDQENKFVE